MVLKKLEFLIVSVQLLVDNFDVYNNDYLVGMHYMIKNVTHCNCYNCACTK